MRLYAPPEYYSLPLLTKLQIANGCGAKGAKFDFVPDTIYGLSITEACLIHDVMYHFGTTISDKEEADRVFLNNMLRLIDDCGGWLKWLRKRRALKYYLAVKHFGGPAFWADKNV